MSETHKATSTVVAKINDVNIVVIENGEKRVAIKPICQALGIDEDAQRRKLKSDEILSSVTVLSTATGADQKEYKMVTIPFMYVFGWLFTINPKNVAEEAREAVVRYKMECYKALYYHFTSYADFVEKKQQAIEAQLVEFETAKANFANAKNEMNEADKQLKKLRKLSFADYDAEQRQLSLFEEKGGCDA